MVLGNEITGLLTASKARSASGKCCKGKGFGGGHWGLDGAWIWAWLGSKRRRPDALFMVVVGKHFAFLQVVV